MKLNIHHSFELQSNTHTGVETLAEISVGNGKNTSLQS